VSELLQIDGISVRFGGVAANSDVSLTLRSGEILGLIGPNGAGKSTLFNLIAGAVKPTSGRIRFAGEDITALPPQERCVRGIARTFQVVKSFETMSVLENVMVGGLNRTGSAREARAAAMQVLDDMGLSARAYDNARTLTPPEKRRLEVARALATKPQLLLLDEVLTGLTPAEAQKGVELVRRIRAAGVSVIMVEHVMEVVMPLVDRAVVLNLGRVLAEGDPRDLVKNKEVIAAYLGDRYNA
jgi:branched-chain amino acid transport system ATP-binding protein